MKDSAACFSDDLLDTAYAWLCTSRKHYPPNADIWHLRFHWEKEKHTLLHTLNAGRYRLTPLSVVKNQLSGSRALWSSSDALVIKCLTLLLTSVLPVHLRCEHVKGHGGGKKSIHRVHHTLRRGEYRFVCRTDIRGYYANINKHTLFKQLKHYVTHPILLDLLSQFLHYSVEYGGVFHTPNKGISRGCSLSPLLAAFHLRCMDTYFASLPGIYYARYMDDFILFTRTRWHLRRCVKQLNAFFNQFGFTQHPDKTFIGSLDKGFDWMGFTFTSRGCTSVAPRALDNHLSKLHRLYEQARKQAGSFRRVVQYCVRWRRWARGTERLMIDNRQPRCPNVAHHRHFVATSIFISTAPLPGLCLLQTKPKN